MTSEERAIANWHISLACNFNCQYCIQGSSHKKGIVDSDVPVKEVIKCLKSTNKKWRVRLLGGEPFVLPEFTEICCELIENDIRISFDTNLSITKKIIEFANSVDPNYVNAITVSLHIEEREKRGAVEEFVQNICLLKNKGFNIHQVKYVLHPSLLHRFEKDYEFFKSKRIILEPTAFLGKYNNISYPDGYSTQERALILSYNPNVAHLSFPSKGLLCNAGKTYIKINLDGTIIRCPGDPRKLGDVYQPLRLYKQPQPCQVARCPCWGEALLADPKVRERIKQSFRKRTLKQMVKKNVQKNQLVRSLYDIAASIYRNVISS